MKKKTMLVIGAALLVFGFVVQLFPDPDIMISDFPLWAYVVGAISGTGLCLIGYAIMHNFLTRNL